MELRENAVALLNYLGMLLQDTPFILDENDRATLAIDDMGAIIDYNEPLESLVITIIIDHIDSHHSELLYDILCGNYMWGFSGDGTIGIDRETELLTIHKLVPLPIEENVVIEDIFASLVGAARYWKARIATASSSMDSSSMNTAGMLRI